MSKEIRFITPNYKTLFMLPDGGSIKITYPDGEELIKVCEFMGETHMNVGGTCYHICQFAELMQRVGARVEKVEVAI